MKKQWISWVSISMLVLLLVSWQGRIKTGNYDNLWKKVRQYSQKDLPKSALKTVELIYTKAKVEGNESQVVKSLLYRIGLQSTFQEDFRLKSIRIFEKERQTAPPVEKQLLGSLLGQLYQGYYDDHFNEILNRKTSAITGDIALEMMDAQQWNRKISRAYLASVSSPDALSKIQLSDFSAILQNDSSVSRLWPTLYDLLANRAIDYFSSRDARLIVIKNPVAMDTSLFVPVNDFLKMNFPGDSIASTGKVLILFQHLLHLHKEQNHPDAFVDADLKRLDFVNSQLPDTFANGLAYAHALERLLQQFQNQEISVRIANRLAQTYWSLSSHKNKTNYLIKAEETCKKALKAFPTAPFANNCKNTITLINEPHFRMKLQQALLPDKPFLSLITYKNSAKLYFRVVKISPDIKNPSAGENISRQMKKFLQRPAFKKWEQSFPFAGDHRMHTAEIAMPALPVGSYVVFVSDNSRFSKESTVLYQQIQVTRLTLLSQKNNSAQALDIYLLDRANGTPVSDATIQVFGRSYDYRAREQQITPLGEYSSDAGGFLQIPLKNDREFNGFILKAFKGKDTTYVNTFSRFYGSLYEEKPVLHTYLFTDRAIYRPGQTVYFKGISVETKGNDARVKAGVKQDVQLMNAQYKKLDEQQLVSDASGSVSGSFVLPDVALNGRFMIKTATGMVSIRMENYKRPAFHVVFDTLKKAFALNDEVTLAGKVAYYFGGMADSLLVKYTVKRESYFPFFYYRDWYPGQPDNVEIAGGMLRTDSLGRFQISFKALANKNIPGNFYPVYRFVLHVEVTDASGETHVATQDIRLSRLALLLKLRVSQNVIREQSHGIKIVTKNLSGAEVPASVQVKLYKLTTPDKFMLKRLWPKPDTVLVAKDYFTQNFPHLAYRNEDDKNHWKQTLITSEEIRVNGNTQVFTKRLERLKPGEYLIVVTAKGQPEVPVRKFFTLTSERSSKLPVKEIFWHNLSADQAEPGDILQLRVGSATGNMRMLYEVLNGREIIQRQWIDPGKKLIKLEIPVGISFRGNFVVRLWAVHSNRFFSWSQTVRVPFTNKKLSVSLQTNRNFLKPGEKEQWTVQIKSASGKNQPAFLLAGMYDASLDIYAANRWKMFPYHSKEAGAAWRSYLFNTGYNRTLFREQTKMLSKTTLLYPHINWFGYPVFATEEPVLYALGSPKREIMAVANEANSIKNRSAEKEKPALTASSALPAEKKNLPRPLLRTNFNETAFFYPDLVTDSTGSVRISFMTPDALTQWKFMVLAYTKEMKTGSFVRKFTARKALMIIPNLPRFVRQGDRLTFTARLSNLSEKTLPVKVNIEFFNPENGKKLNPFLVPKTVEQHVVMLPGKNALVSWLIHIPQDIQFLAYRIKAVSGDVSDGEERMIPVLSNRELITESMPMFVNGNRQKTFTFDSFLNDTSVTRKNFRYTLAFTSHPVWYAVQALPYLSRPQYESAENIFYRFYAHTLAGKLLKTYPRIQQVFQQWKRHSPEAFLSALQKDKELKNIVLQATPWMLDAQNEAEQKRRVALFFDLNQMQRQQQIALNKLKIVQQPSGAWPWFPDMPADFLTTENILSGFADLVQMKAIDLKQQSALKIMLQKGLHFLDKKMVDEYGEIKKKYSETIDKNHLTSIRIHYCYLRSAFLTTVPLNPDARKAFDYFSGQIKQYWPKLDNNLQALSAMTLSRVGWTNQAEAIIRALTEKSLLNKENGMYWRNENRFYANTSAISTEANIMKAFVEVMHDTRPADKMKTWLLMQKQANHWPGTKATADAVYALLMNGSQWLSETKPVEIIFGNGEKLSVSDLHREAGSGYIKKVWTAAEITPALGKISVRNPNKGMAYGAAYWQYFEDMNKVSRQSTDVSIKKTFFKEVITAKGNEWAGIADDAPLKIGDRVMVRLLIRANRTVDYVHVQDMWAAAFEPEKLLSGYERKGGLSYYEEVKDVATNFFIRHLPKGTFVLEYPLLVTQKGVFSGGIARIRSLYLPSFAAHSSGTKIKVR